MYLNDIVDMSVLITKGLTVTYDVFKYGDATREPTKDIV